MKNPRRFRLRARLAAVALAVWGLILFVMVTLLWPLAFLFAPLVLGWCWLVGREFDDGFDDL
jgi:hypothetical protein